MMCFLSARDKKKKTKSLSSISPSLSVRCSTVHNWSFISGVKKNLMKGTFRNQFSEPFPLRAWNDNVNLRQKSNSHTLNEIVAPITH